MVLTLESEHAQAELASMSERCVDRDPSRSQQNADSHGELVIGSLVWDLSRDELSPSLVGLVDDLDGVFLVLGLSGEGKDVLRLALSCSNLEGVSGSGLQFAPRIANRPLTNEREKLDSPLAFHRGSCRFGTTRW